VFHPLRFRSKQLDVEPTEAIDLPTPAISIWRGKEIRIPTICYDAPDATKH